MMTGKGIPGREMSSMMLQMQEHGMLGTADVRYEWTMVSHDNGLVAVCESTINKGLTLQGGKGLPDERWLGEFSELQ